MTEEIFRKDAYARRCEAIVVAADARGVMLDRTVFYPEGGGQPGDSGHLSLAEGGKSDRIRITDTRLDPLQRGILHVLADDVALPPTGTRVQAEIDWERRYRHMRLHSCLHLLCSLIDGGVTGGSISEHRARLDFDLQNVSLDKEQLTRDLNRLIGENHALSATWISDEEMALREELVRTMSVKPPTGQGRVRLMEVAGVDLQPCGGTHVRATGEIGAVRVSKIENKGRRNRRVNVVFDTREAP